MATKTVVLNDELLIIIQKINENEKFDSLSKTINYLAVMGLDRYNQIHNTDFKFAGGF